MSDQNIGRNAFGAVLIYVCVILFILWLAGGGK